MDVQRLQFWTFWTSLKFSAAHPKMFLLIASDILAKGGRKVMLLLWTSSCHQKEGRQQDKRGTVCRSLHHLNLGGPGALWLSASQAHLSQPLPDRLSSSIVAWTDFRDGHCLFSTSLSHLCPGNYLVPASSLPGLWLITSWVSYTREYFVEYLCLDLCLDLRGTVLSFIKILLWLKLDSVSCFKTLNSFYTCYKC